MPKSIHSDEQSRFLKLLRETREKAGMTQVQLANKLGVPQSFISKVESGERRVDLIELQGICRALGSSLSQFIRRFEGR